MNGDVGAISFWVGYTVFGLFVLVCAVAWDAPGFLPLAGFALVLGSARATYLVMHSKAKREDRA